MEGIIVNIILWALAVTGVILMILSAIGISLGSTFLIMSIALSIKEGDLRDNMQIILIILLFVVLSFTYVTMSLNQSAKYTWDEGKELNIERYIGISSEGHNSNTVMVFLLTNGSTVSIPKNECKIIISNDNKTKVIMYSSVPNNLYKTLFFMGLDMPKHKYDIEISEVDYNNTK